MKLLQISPSLNQSCGVGFFAENMQKYMSNYCEVRTVSDIEVDLLADFDCCIIHYINQISKLKVLEIQKKIKTFLFLHHSRKEEDIIPGDYFVLNRLAKTKYKNYLIPHPCYTEKLKDRFELKKEKQLEEKILIGTCGFFNKNRRLFEICDFLTSNLDEKYLIYLSCTPHFKWDSKKIIEDLKKFSHGKIFINEKSLTHKEINENMQMCDLVWCWTDASQGNYGSGVASDLYGSGTKLVIQQRPQHEHVLNRKKNVIVAENNFENFLGTILKESLSRKFEREFDYSISWESIAGFIFKIISQKLL